MSLILPTTWDEVENIDWAEIKDTDVWRLDIWFALYGAVRERRKSVGGSTDLPGGKHALAKLFDVNPIGPFFSHVQAWPTMFFISEVLRLDLLTSHMNHTKSQTYDGLTESEFLDLKWTTADISDAIDTDGLVWLSPETGERLDPLSDHVEATPTTKLLKKFIEQAYDILNLLRIPEMAIDTSTTFDRENNTGISFISWEEAEALFNASSFIPGGLSAESNEYSGSFFAFGTVFTKTAVRFKEYRRFFDVIGGLGYDLSGPMKLLVFPNVPTSGLEVFGNVDEGEVYNLANTISPFTILDGDVSTLFTSEDFKFLTDAQLSANTEPPPSNASGLGPGAVGPPAPVRITWDLRGVQGYRYQAFD